MSAIQLFTKKHCALSYMQDNIEAVIIVFNVAVSHTLNNIQYKLLLKVVYLFCGGILICETGSSVSIVSGYGLDERAIEVRSPVEAKEFFL
jgi:hypothetical protein